MRARPSTARTLSFISGHTWEQVFDLPESAAECSDCGLIFTHTNFWNAEVPPCPGPDFRLTYLADIETVEGRHRSDRG